MGIYLFIVILIIYLNFIIKPNYRNRSSRIYLIYLYVIITFLMCVRTRYVGADTIQYYNAFKTLDRHSLDWAINNYRYEIGFSAFCKALSFVSHDSQMLIIISSLCIFSSVFFFLYRNSEDLHGSLLIFIFLNYFFLYISAMRQAIAISILLLGYTFFYRNDKYIKFFITVLLAALFHSSAIICVIFIFIPKNTEYKKNILYFMIVLSIVCFVFSNEIFSFFMKTSKYGYYEESEDYTGSAFAGYLNYFMCLAILLFSFVYRPKPYYNNINYNKYLYFVSINLVFYALAAKISIFTRVTSFFDIFNCIYIPIALKNINSLNNKKMISSMFWCLLFAHWIIIAVYRPEWYGAIPYESIFFRRN